jgi:hypothetical protein
MLGPVLAYIRVSVFIRGLIHVRQREIVIKRLATHSVKGSKYYCYRTAVGN